LIDSPIFFASLKANVSHGVVKVGMTWEKGGLELFAKLKLEMHFIQRLHQEHDLSMKPRKLGRPSTQIKKATLSRPCINECTCVKQSPS
jgi:hypothetical protein